MFVGNFESDYALNMLAGWINQIVDRIRETFTFDSQDSHYGRRGEEEIVANVDIFATLLKEYRFYTDVEISEIQQWKRLLHFTRQPGDRFHVKHARLGNTGIPAATRVVDDAAAHELGKIFAQQRGWTSNGAMSQPVPDIDHSEIRRASGQRGKALYA